METFKTYARFLHLPTLLLIAGIELMMFYFIILPSSKSLGIEPSMHLMDLINIIGATVFLAAGGFVINDYFDMKIDQINRPLTRIVGKVIEKQTAMTLYTILTAIGICFTIFLCWNARSITYALLILLISGVLWFYSSSYKRMLVLGNVIVALLMGLTPLIVAVFENQFLSIEYKPSPDLTYVQNQNITYTAWFSLLAFGWTFLIEVIKDMATQKGDRELECHTFPVVLGEEKTKWILYGWILLIILGFAYIIYQSPLLQNGLSYRFYVCGTLIPAISLFYFIAKAQNAGDYRVITKYTFVIFAINMCYSFVLYSVLDV